MLPWFESVKPGLRGPHTAGSDISCFLKLLSEISCQNRALGSAADRTRRRELHATLGWYIALGSTGQSGVSAESVHSRRWAYEDKQG
jgi:hypothetical protein